MKWFFQLEWFKKLIPKIWLLYIVIISPGISGHKISDISWNSGSSPSLAHTRSILKKAHYTSKHHSTHTRHPQHLPNPIFGHYILGLLHIHGCNKVSLPHFVPNLPQHKNLIHTISAPSKLTSLFSELPFTIFNHPANTNSTIWHSICIDISCKNSFLHLTIF